MTAFSKVDYGSRVSVSMISVSPSKQVERSKLESDVERFLSRGGEVKTLPGVIERPKPIVERKPSGAVLAVSKTAPSKHVRSGTPKGYVNRTDFMRLLGIHSEGKKSVDRFLAMIESGEIPAATRVVNYPSRSYFYWERSVAEQYAGKAYAKSMPEKQTSLSDDEIAIARKMLAIGETYHAIGKKLGRCRKTVKRAIEIVGES